MNFEAAKELVNNIIPSIEELDAHVKDGDELAWQDVFGPDPIIYVSVKFNDDDGNMHTFDVFMNMVDYGQRDLPDGEVYITNVLYPHHYVNEKSEGDLRYDKSGYGIRIDETDPVTRNSVAKGVDEKVGKRLAGWVTCEALALHEFLVEELQAAGLEVVQSHCIVEDYLTEGFGISEKLQNELDEAGI